MSLALKRPGWVVEKKKVIKVLNLESDYNNYKTYKSATQEKINSSNADWLIKIKLRVNTKRCK